MRRKLQFFKILISFLFKQYYVLDMVYINTILYSNGIGVNFIYNFHFLRLYSRRGKSLLCFDYSLYRKNSITKKCRAEDSEKSKELFCIVYKLFVFIT